MEWEDLASWWQAEVRSDPAYREQVTPLLLDLLAPQPGGRYLDVGCGEGAGMRAVMAAGAVPFGCDVSADLLAVARRTGPVIRCRLPALDWLRSAVMDGAYAVLVFEHLALLPELFAGLRRVVRPGGVLAAVCNHPAFTAPGSGPVVDPTDGELFWRWGPYLEPGTSTEPAGSDTVTFHHRPLGSVLTEAAGAGWCLERLEEAGPGEAAVARDPLLARQRHVPRLLGVRWTAG